jgi:hypothetical protein
MKRETTADENDLVRSAVTGALPRRELIRRGLRAGLGLSAVAALALTPRSGDAAAARSIPPNCIRVCCYADCRDWKMCWKCVQWPKPTTTVASQ